MANEAELDITLFTIAVSPLLRLVSHLTGFETAFITEIDLAAGRQRVVLSENSGRLQLSTGAEVDWSDSMCQLMFSHQLTATDQLNEIFPSSKGVQLGMQSFVVLPIKLDGNIIGSLCGADSEPKSISQAQEISLQFIAEALALQLQALLDAQQARLKVSSLQNKVQNLAELANTDPLTKLLNRRGFQLRCDEVASQCRRSHLSLAIMMIDIDNFKHFNDGHGHEHGDDMIRMLADGLRQLARTTDVACRLGGDEFVMVAIDTDPAGMTVLADRLVNYMRQQTKPLGLHCTLSIGIASGMDASVEQLMKQADEALYQSKAAGRNAITVASPEGQHGDPL